MKRVELNIIEIIKEYKETDISINKLAKKT